MESLESQEMCQYIQRLGVCLEPLICQRKHKTTFNLNAPVFEFNPGASQADEQSGIRFDNAEFQEDEDFLKTRS